MSIKDQIRFIYEMIERILENWYWGGLAVYPFAMALIIVGNLTGNFRGYYAVSQLAADVLLVLIPLMMVGMLVWAIGKNAN